MLKIEDRKKVNTEYGRRKRVIIIIIIIIKEMLMCALRALVNNLF